MITRRSLFKIGGLGGMEFVLSNCTPRKPAGLESKIQEPQKKVAIFAGHVSSSNLSRNNQGCRSYYGVKEYSFNDGIVGYFSSLINQLIKYDTHLARENISILDRTKLSQDNGSDVYVEIHHDSAQRPDIDRLRKNAKTEQEWRELSGFSVFYSPNNGNPEESLRLAKLIGDELLKIGLRPNLYHAKDIKGERKKLVDEEKGVYESPSDYEKDFYVLKENKMPAVIVECGVIVNPYEEAKLRQPETQKKIAIAIDSALKEYFRTQRGLK